MTPLERLKALAAAKKQQEKQDAPAPVPPVATLDAPAVPTEQVPTAKTATAAQVPEVTEPATQSKEISGSSEVQAVAVPARAEHPLLMELAELEQALTEKLPDFRTILRDIHQKLRNDPELVTTLSEDEIGLIVSGLATHANAEIVAPKAAKAAKSAVSAARKAAKGPVSASDL